MNNQAAQTMPELPEPEELLHSPMHGNVYGFTASQMHQYARDYAAALSQTAGVPREPTRDHIEAFKRAEIKCVADYDDDMSPEYRGLEAVFAMLAAAPAASGGEDGALNLRGDETNQEVLAEFIRVCREVKPVGQWPGERVCRAIENLMNGPRDFISPDDRSPLRFGVGRGNEGGRLGLMGRDLAQPQHDAAGDAKCIWPDCGHDTNQVGYSSGCTGAYCPACKPPAAASVSERARELLAHELEHGGFPEAAHAVRNGYVPQQAPALRALEQALTQQRVAASYDAGMAMHWIERYAAGIDEECQLDRIAEAFTTPQPSANAVRELVAKWREDAEIADRNTEGNSYASCADELESLLSAASGEKGVG